MPNNLIDIRQTPKYAHYMQSIGWQISNVLINKKKVYYFVKKIKPLLFSFIKIHRNNENISLKTLKGIAKEHKSLWIKISPFKYKQGKNTVIFTRPLIYKFYSPKKIHQDKDHLIATKTIWIDLKLNEKKLLTNMRPKTRYNIGKAQRNKLKPQILFGDKITKTQIKDIYRLWNKNNKQKKLYTPAINELIQLIKAFDKNCFIVQIKKNNGLIAFSLVLLSPNMAFYWHNAGNNLGRKLFAPTLCAWEGIKQSKKLNKSIFDFEGIYDERYARWGKNWKGFSRFKKGFV